MASSTTAMSTGPNGVDFVLGHIHPDLHEPPWRLQRMETAHHAVQEDVGDQQEEKRGDDQPDS